MKLMGQVRGRLRAMHYSYRTEQSYIRWLIRFIHFHKLQHPINMGGPEIEEFLTDLAAGAKRPQRLPVVLSRGEVREILARMRGVYRLMAEVMYGGGLRLRGCCRLRMHDVDLEDRLIIVRQGKGQKDRATIPPAVCIETIYQQLTWRGTIHEQDPADGEGRAELPRAIERKHPKAAWSLGRQFVFASHKLSRDPRTGRRGRHYVHPSSIQRAIEQAVRATGVVKRVTSHTFRHNKPSRLRKATSRQASDARSSTIVPCQRHNHLIQNELVRCDISRDVK